MQVIVNQEELVEPLAKQILKRHYKKGVVDYRDLDVYLNKAQKRFKKNQVLDIDFAEVNNLIRRALLHYTDNLIIDYKTHYRSLIKWLVDKLPTSGIHSGQLLEWYADPLHKGFVKNVAQHISSEINYVVDDDYSDCAFIRNIVNNEEYIKHRLLNRKEFWFTDAGYTNFIAAKGKPWHRLCHNHIHQSLTHLNFPADRLKLLDTMPRPWRTSGNKILVVESSDYHYHMLGTDRGAWRDTITNVLAEHTDRPVEYRAKDMDRKVRQSVYELLMSSDEYYCVISDSSAAAIEAVWAGVPIITLNKHISIPVARTQVSDINNLYRGPVGDWLCALSYSQFTKKEMQNGTAWKIIEKYHV